MSGKENEQKEIERVSPVPYNAHESDMARLDQSNKRLAFALAAVSVISVLVIAFCSFLNYKKDLEWNKTFRDLNQQILNLNQEVLDTMKSFEYETEEIVVDGKDSGMAKYIGDGSRNYEGDYYGTDHSSEDPEDISGG